MTVRPVRPAAQRSATGSPHGTGTRPSCPTYPTSKESGRGKKGDGAASRKEAWVPKADQGGQVGRDTAGRGLSAVRPSGAGPTLADSTRRRVKVWGRLLHSAHPTTNTHSDHVHVANNHVAGGVPDTKKTPKGWASMKPAPISGICPGSRRGHGGILADRSRLDDLKPAGCGPRAARSVGVDLDDDEPSVVTGAKRDATTTPSERNCSVCGCHHSPAALANPVMLRAVHAAMRLRVKRAIQAFNAPKGGR